MTQAQGRFIPLSGLLAAGRAGDFPVCVDAQRSVAWRDFALLCGGIVSVVRARPEQRWLVHCEHPLHFAAALLSLLHAGRRAESWRRLKDL
jgi:hypothetical protein